MKMKSIVTYVRNLLGWCEDDPANNTSFKRDREFDDDGSSDDEVPTLKRLKNLTQTKFPETMTTRDVWDNEDRKKQNVRYIPIQVETVQPSTSTPNDSQVRLGGRVRNVPIKFVDMTGNGASTPSRKPRIHTPVRPVIQAVIDDDEEVTYVATKPERKKPSRVYINLEEEEDCEEGEPEDQPDDVIFVKRITTPPPVKPYKFFISKNEGTGNDNEVKYFKLCSKPKERNLNVSPKTYNKFKYPAGITKTYKKSPTPIPKWMQTQKTNLPQTKNRFFNGNKKSTVTEVFNLDEKRMYQELIRQMSSSDAIQPVTYNKQKNILNLAEDSAAFRLTQRSQKNALNEINLLEKDRETEKDNEATKEYDPITVASINSSDSEFELITSDASTSSSVRIVPINSLRDLQKDRPVTANDWLVKLDRKYRKKNQLIQEKLKDARRESDIISKVNYEQKLAHLEHKLKYELSIPESLIEEAQPTVELPRLTPEQEKLVSRALGPGPPGQLLIEKFNLRIHRRDLQTFSGLNWLNDEVINFYMNLLMQRSAERPELPRVYATNTFFYPKLMQAGQAGLRRWTRKVDVFAHDLLVVPVHLGVHWCLALVQLARRRVAYLDSMGGRNQPCLDALLQYLRDEHLDKKGQPFDDSGWTTENLKDIPQQMNGSDCGVFACTFAEFSSRDAPYTFTQAHMPYLRRKAALEILRGKLLL